MSSEQNQKRLTDVFDPDEFALGLIPTHHRPSSQGGRSKEYKFTKAHMDFDPQSVFDNRADYEVLEDGVLYRYRNREPVKITESSVVAREGCDVREAEKQAYFALSYLESAGYVTGWGVR